MIRLSFSTILRMADQTAIKGAPIIIKSITQLDRQVWAVL